VKKSVAASSPQCAFRKERQEVGLSGADQIPLSFRTFAIVLGAT